MTAAQSLRIYEVLGRHFNNTEDARIVVTEIEQIIETKISEKKDILATKADVALLKDDLALLKDDLKKDIMTTKENLLKLQIDIEKRFNQLTIWLVGIFVALAGIIIGVAKL